MSGASGYGTAASGRFTDGIYGGRWTASGRLATDCSLRSEAWADEWENMTGARLAAIAARIVSGDT